MLALRRSVRHCGRTQPGREQDITFHCRAPRCVWPMTTAPPIVRGVHKSCSEVGHSDGGSIEVVAVGYYGCRCLYGDIDSLILNDVVEDLGSGNSPRAGNIDPGGSRCRRIVGIGAVAGDVIADDPV